MLGASAFAYCYYGYSHGLRFNPDLFELGAHAMVPLCLPCFQFETGNVGSVALVVAVGMLVEGCMVVVGTGDAVVSVASLQVGSLKVADEHLFALQHRPLTCCVPVASDS